MLGQASYNYKRLNHLQEVLSRFNRAEPEIPNQAIELVKYGMVEDQLSPADLTPRKIRHYLMKVKPEMSRYYDYSEGIISILNNEEIPLISDAQIRRLTDFFEQFEKIFFEMHPDRYNTIGFHNVLYFGCLHSDYSKLLKYFPRPVSASVYRTGLMVYNQLLRRAQIKIASWWRVILAKRRLQRLRINHELVVLPGVGVEYQNALERFSLAVLGEN